MITLKLTDSQARSISLLLERVQNKDTQQIVVHNKILTALIDGHYTQLEPNIYLSDDDVELALKLIEFVEQCDYNMPLQVKSLKQKLETLRIK